MDSLFNGARHRSSPHIHEPRSLENSQQIKTATENLPEGAQQQASGVVAGVSNVATGVAGTAGGAVKGILDTAGNTVCHTYFNLLLLYLPELPFFKPSKSEHYEVDTHSGWHPRRRRRFHPPRHRDRPWQHRPVRRQRLHFESRRNLFILLFRHGEFCN